MRQDKLIQLVREYTFLYDLNDCRYNDNQRKEDAWKEIAKRMYENEKDCRKTWALLRDSYRRTIRKRMEGNDGPAKPPKRKWKYEDDMSFILPFIRDKHNISVIPETYIGRTSDNVNDGSNEDSEGRSASPAIKRQYSPLPIMAKVWDASMAQPSTSTELDKKTKITEIQQFFQSIATTVQSFPPRDRAIAKAKVFAVISEMELDILSRDPNTSEYAG